MSCATCLQEPPCFCERTRESRRVQPAETIRGIPVTVRENRLRGCFEIRFRDAKDLVWVWLNAPDAAAGLAWAREILERADRYLPPAVPEPARPAAAPAPDPAADSSSLPLVTLYTDGSNRGSPGPGGWGALLQMDGHERELSGPIPSATNNIAELTAVIEGLKALRKPCRVRLVSDSQYVVNGIMHQSKLRRWVKNGWKLADGKPVANRELWEAVWQLLQVHLVTAEWVKGHAGHPENTRVDALAGAASQAEKLRQQQATAAAHG